MACCMCTCACTCACTRAPQVLGIALCHDVSPVERQTGGDAPAARFQGASPDELALVQFAAQCGITLHARRRLDWIFFVPVYRYEKHR